MVYTIEDIKRYVQRYYGNARLLVTPFGYTVTFPTVPFGANPGDRPTVAQIINISGNADFLAMGVSHTVLTDGLIIATTPATLIESQLEDTGSNEKFSHDPIQLEAYSSNGVAEIDFDYPRFLSGKSQIKVSLTNYSGDTAADITYTNVDVFLSGCLVRVYGN